MGLLAVDFGVIAEFRNVIKREVIIRDFTLLNTNDIGIKALNNGFELVQAHSDAVGVK